MLSLSLGHRQAAQLFFTIRTADMHQTGMRSPSSKMAAIRTRPLENLLKFKPKNKEKRKVIYKKLITALVQYERLETTINRCHDLSRVAERVSILFACFHERYSFLQ